MLLCTYGLHTKRPRSIFFSITANIGICTILKINLEILNLKKLFNNNFEDSVNIATLLGTNQ